jgi:hypothetical protein
VKIPPYGKPLKALLEQGQLPSNSVYLYIGEKAWDKAKATAMSRPTRTLILPPEKNPSDYDWPVKGCDILIIETTEVDTEYIEHFVLILFSYGATRVTLISTDFIFSVYEKDFNHVK